MIAYPAEEGEDEENFGQLGEEFNFEEKKQYNKEIGYNKFADCNQNKESIIENSLYRIKKQSNNSAVMKNLFESQKFDQINNFYQEENMGENNSKPKAEEMEEHKPVNV